MAPDSQKQFELDINEYDELDEDRVTIKKIRRGDITACDDLLKKYDSLVKFLASKYYVAGGDQNDLMQEGRLGMLNAIKGFDLGKDTPFHAFARICIQRKIDTAIKNSTRQKHIPLNSSVSLTQEAFDEGDEGRQVIEMIGAEVPDPADMIASKEVYTQICMKMGTVLSPFEKDVFRCRLDGYSQKQMAERLGTNEKAIDNALQRIKGKVIKHCHGSDEVEI